MFTGIIQFCTQPYDIIRRGDIIELVFQVSRDFVRGLQRGYSISVDGVCLTVSAIKDNKISFQVVPETLKKTTLGQITDNDCVNLERSLKMGGEIGGHILNGHIVGTVTIAKIVRKSVNYYLTVTIPQQWKKFFYEKGFVALNGVSLTIAQWQLETSLLTVALIPETLAQTNLGSKKVGDFCNLEIDSTTRILVETAEKFLSQISPSLLVDKK